MPSGQTASSTSCSTICPSYDQVELADVHPRRTAHVCRVLRRLPLLDSKAYFEDTGSRRRDRDSGRGEERWSASPGTAAPLGETIVAALGGSENIEAVDNCYTRLRLVVKDPGVVDEQKLKETGSKGVIKSGNNVQ